MALRRGKGLLSSLADTLRGRPSEGSNLNASGGGGDASGSGGLGEQQGGIYGAGVGASPPGGGPPSPLLLQGPLGARLGQLGKKPSRMDLTAGTSSGGNPLGGGTPSRQSDVASLWGPSGGVTQVRRV